MAARLLALLAAGAFNLAWAAFLAWSVRAGLASAWLAWTVPVPVAAGLGCFGLVAHVSRLAALGGRP